MSTSGRRLLAEHVHADGEFDVVFHLAVYCGEAEWCVRPRQRHLREQREAMWQGAIVYLQARWAQRPARHHPR